MERSDSDSQGEAQQPLNPSSMLTDFPLCCLESHPYSLSSVVVSRIEKETI